MRTPIRVLGLLVAVTLSAASSGWAQKGAVELGADMDFSLTIPSGGGDNVFSIGLPVGTQLTGGATGGVRAGFWVSDPVSIEPSLSFGLASGGGETVWSVSSAILLLYHFTTDPEKSRFFLGLGPNIFVIHLGGGGFSSTNTQFGVVGEGGVLLPVASHFALRLAAGGARFFESSDLVARWSIFGTFGFSVFLGGS